MTDIKELANLRDDLRTSRDALAKLPPDARSSRMTLELHILRTEAKIDALVTKNVNNK